MGQGILHAGDGIAQLRRVGVDLLLDRGQLDILELGDPGIGEDPYVRVLLLLLGARATPYSGSGGSPAGRSRFAPRVTSTPGGAWDSTSSPLVVRTKGAGSSAGPGGVWQAARPITSPTTRQLSVIDRFIHATIRKVAPSR
jgi:hypothetical protein